MIYHKKSLTNDRNIPGNLHILIYYIILYIIHIHILKNLRLKHISKYLVKLMSSTYTFHIFETKHTLKTFQNANFWLSNQLNFY